MKAIEITRAIESRINPANIQSYYIGITNDVERRLFEEHNVDKNNNWWLSAPADDKETAQFVEEYFLKRGMQGDTGGGTDDTVYVYCYEITPYTIE